MRLSGEPTIVEYKTRHAHTLYIYISQDQAQTFSWKRSPGDTHQRRAGKPCAN